MITRVNRRDREVAILVCALLAVGLISAADHTLWRRELSSSIFYLVPISFAAWFGRWRLSGLVVAAAAAGAWHVVDVLRAAYSNPAAPYWNTGVRLAFFVITAHLIASVRRSLAREAALADTDSLTGLANSRRFIEELEGELARMERSGRSCTVALLDLDDFKELNDRHGHATGDRAIREVAGVLRASTRAVDVIARLGGDEFALMLPETDRSGAEGVLGRIGDQLRHVMEANGWPVTCSIGAIVLDAPVDQGSSAIRMADELMYQVKGRGKDGLLIETYDASPAHTTDEKTPARSSEG